MYRTCPLSYKLRYIDRLKPKEKWYFSFGTSLHACVEYFFRVNTPPPPSLEELLQFYEQNWLSEGYASPEEEAGYRTYGREILTRFWEKHYPDFRMPIALERSFMVDIEGVKLRGFIDRVDKLDSGGLSIVDYKTGKELFTADYLSEDLQLTIYQLAAERTWGLPVEKLTLYHLRSNTPCSCRPREEPRLEETRRLICDVAENITAGNYPAVENQFCPCDFPEHCPYHRHKFLAAAPPAPKQEPLPGIAIIDTVEQYAELQARIKELQVESEEVRQDIIDYCQSADLNRVYGNTCDVTFRLVERTGFDEAEVRAILGPAGLWEKVQGLDQTKLKKLFTEGTINSELKKTLEKLRRITSSYPQLWLRKKEEEEEEDFL